MSAPSFVDALTQQVDQRPDSTALWVEAPRASPTSISWRSLATAVVRVSRLLEQRFARDPRRPRRIGHASDNSVVDVVIALASVVCHAVEIPLDRRLNRSEIERRFQRVGGHWFDERARQSIDAEMATATEQPASREDLLKVFASRGEQVAWLDDPSLILWTSGTTGTPQGVTLSQRCLVGNAAAKLRAVPQNQSDRRLTLLPLSHAYARTCDFGTWLLSGCELGLTLGYDAFCHLAPQLQPTLVNCVPAVAYRLLKETPSGLQKLRLLGCGGAPISQQAFEAWKDRGVTVIQGYGLTESGPVICSATPENAAPGVVGDFVDGWESRILDGELSVRGPHTMLHYWNDESATWNKIDPDGWLATGDLVERDEATQQIRILGRADDVIVLDSGIKLSPLAIEREIERIAGIEHAMLLDRKGLQLWVDLATEANFETVQQTIDDLLGRSKDLKTCSVHPFVPRLAMSTGELTAKGTIRREQIVRNRWSN